MQNHRKTIKLIPSLFLLASGALFSGCVALSPAALDLEGRPSNPFAEKNITATVLIFVSNDCPISNRYVPEFARLQDEYGARGVHFWLVHADAAETPAEIREHARQFGLKIREIRDPGQRLARLSHAEVTPTAAVFTQGRMLVYHGWIDDRLARLGVERAVPLHQDLAGALDAVLAGRAVPVPVTKAIGCSIP